MPDGLQPLLEPGADPALNQAAVQRLTLQDYEAVGAAITVCDALCAPAGEAGTTELIARLFNHYVPRFDGQGLTEALGRQILMMKQQVKKDWLEDFREFPAWALADACRDWRRGPKGMFQPSIAELRTLCAKVMFPVKRLRLQADMIAGEGRRQAMFDAAFRRQAEERKASGAAEAARARLLGALKVPAAS